MLKKKKRQDPKRLEEKLDRLHYRMDKLEFEHSLFMDYYIKEALKLAQKKRLRDYVV